MRFFFDNNLSPKLANGMREFGEDVVHLTEHFSAGAVDGEWLPFVGTNQFVLVTRDERIRWRPAELQAIRSHRVACFLLGGKNLDRCQLIQQLVRNWPRMKQLAASERRPFAFRIPPSGSKVTKLAL